MSLTKLSLGENNLYMTSLFLPKESLVSDIQGARVHGSCKPKGHWVPVFLLGHFILLLASWLAAHLHHIQLMSGLYLLWELPEMLHQLLWTKLTCD
jgi:hypothetical protein